MKSRPKLLFADDQGRIYDHPFLEMVGASGSHNVRPRIPDVAPLPPMSKLYFHPGCPPYGYDPVKRKIVLLTTTRVGGRTVRCHAVSAFIRQGWVRLLLPAMDTGAKKEVLPMWAYSAVGFADGSYCAPCFLIDDNFRWDPEQFDDRTLPAAIRGRMREYPGNRLVKHLRRCAARYHCFAAKNFFYRRWEAPIPTSPACNAGCLGCISLQPDSPCMAPQDRIGFVPELEEIAGPFIRHLETAPDSIVSFGQGCEGEPIMQWRRISSAIRAFRRATDRGTINLNTNGSVPRFVETICKSGLDSIRISLNSARKDLYLRYYRPRGYGFEDVAASITGARDHGVFTMINYLVFPGITDQEPEVEALCKLIHSTKPHLIHFKNLNIDPDLYFAAMGSPPGRGIGVKKVIKILQDEFPYLQFGYYNKTKAAFNADPGDYRHRARIRRC